MNENNVQHPVQWLRCLFYICAAGLGVSVISWLLPGAGFLSWVSRGLVLASAYCLFRLSPASDRYRKAAIFRVIYQIAAVVNMLLPSTVLMLAASVCSLLAIYQEYSGHSDLVAQKDPKLSRKWHSLFNWSIAAAVISAFASMIVALITVMLELSVSGIVSVVTFIVLLPDEIVTLISLVYLHRMIQLLQEEE